MASFLAILNLFSSSPFYEAEGEKKEVSMYFYNSVAAREFLFITTVDMN